MPTGPTIRAVVFDFDGTLVLSNRLKEDAFAATARRYGIDEDTLATVRADRVGANRHAIFAELSDRLKQAGHTAVPEGPALAAGYGTIVLEQLAVVARVPGADEMLAALAARGLALFINSATPEIDLDDALAAARLRERFVGFYGGPSSKHENLARIAARTGCSPESILMVGDGDDDRIGARMFGSPFVGVVVDQTRHGASNHVFRETPSHVVSDLRDLIDIIDRLDHRTSPTPRI